MADIFEGMKIVTWDALQEYYKLDQEDMHKYVEEHAGKSVCVGTSEYWNTQPTLIASKDVMYYYSDIKNFKIGDGISYLSTLPFVLDTDEWKKHMDYSMSDSTETLTLTKNF